MTSLPSVVLVREVLEGLGGVGQRVGPTDGNSDLPLNDEVRERGQMGRVPADVRYDTLPICDDSPAPPTTEVA